MLFLMHRVELKALLEGYYRIVITKFLMHRVELKGQCCGRRVCKEGVPNAPCGVERRTGCWLALAFFGFLMHRVELKA